MFNLQGAIDANSRKYYTPSQAAVRSYSREAMTSKPEYICPDCNRRLAFKNGEIKQAHFAHHAVAAGEQQCTFYQTNESDMHKHGKNAVLAIIEKRIPLRIVRACTARNCRVRTEAVYELTDYTGVTAKLEYRFPYNGTTRCADVAILRNDAIEYIIEVFHTHRTAVENRPSNFCDIKADDLVNHLQYRYDTTTPSPDQVTLVCRRPHMCKPCIMQIEQDEINKTKAQEQREAERKRCDADKKQRDKEIIEKQEEDRRQKREEEYAQVRRTNEAREAAAAAKKAEEFAERERCEQQHIADLSSPDSAIRTAAEKEQKRRDAIQQLIEIRKEWAFAKEERERKLKEESRYLKRHRRILQEVLYDITMLGEGYECAYIYEDNSNSALPRRWAVETPSLIMR